MPALLTRPLTLTEALAAAPRACRLRCEADGVVYYVTRTASAQIVAEEVYCGLAAEIDVEDVLTLRGWEHV